MITNNPLDDLIIDRLCNNDNLFELNNLCGILDNVTDHDTRQEDRLAYFKQSTIEDLLGVANESEKFKKIQSRRKAVDKVYKEIKEKIDSKRKYVLENEFKNDPTTKYEPLLDGVQIWDSVQKSQSRADNSAAAILCP